LRKTAKTAIIKARVMKKINEELQNMNCSYNMVTKAMLSKKQQTV
jgi:hypothetical protein